VLISLELDNYISHADPYEQEVDPVPKLTEVIS